MALPVRSLASYRRIRPGSPRAVAWTGGEVLPIVRWAFYLFVASLPFEMPHRTIPFEIPTITGSILLATTALQPGTCFRRIPGAFAWFVVYLSIFGAAVMSQGAENAVKVKELLLLLVQAMLVFWMASNLLRDEEIARAALRSLALAAVLSALLPLVGVGRTAVTVWTGGERIAAFGQNPNQRAVILGAGLLALAGLQYATRRPALRPRWLCWPLGAILILGIVATGSRVGLLAVCLGLLAFTLGARTLRTRLRNTLVLLLAVAGFLGAVSQSTVMRNRLKPSEVETLSGRERLFPALWEMFLEKPTLGWGPTNNQFEVAKRIGDRKHKSRDAHNLFLELLTATGVFGFVPFVVGLSLCAVAAWRGRRGSLGPVPLALLMALLVANTSGNRLADKTFWLILAYAVASGATVARVVSPSMLAPSALIRSGRLA
jgi:O-antigen ligase